MMRYWAAIIAAVSLSGTAIAGEKPLYDAIPSWVRPAPPIDATNLGESAPVVLLYDNQQRLQDGQVWSYVDSATRIATTQMLTALGTLQLAWQPAHGDLIVHRAEIMRGSEHINLLKGEGTFSVLRREQQIERRVLTGVLTATLSVEGLRVGDVLHMSFSATTRDPTLKGNMQSVAPIIFDPFRTQFARVRFLWPKGAPVQARGYADALTASPVLTSDGLRDFTVNLPIAKPAELPSDAPGRFQKLPIVEASSFRNWADVATVMAPLYVTSGRIEPTSPRHED